MRVNLFRYGWLLPLIAGGAWGLTLSILLGHWLADGRPVYSGQSNPYVAFISDIAAFALKPVFITGSCLTALTYFGTIWLANHIRYAQNGYALTEDARWRKIVSSVAVIVSFEASISLVLLAGFDTLRAHERHRILLLCTFGGLGLSAVLTGITWSDQLKLNVEFPNLRRWCIVNTLLVITISALGFAFVGMLYSGWMRTAGVLEWTLTYLGAFWLLTFIGYLKLPGDSDSSQTYERRPLLSAQSP